MRAAADRIDPIEVRGRARRRALAQNFRVEEAFVVGLQSGCGEVQRVGHRTPADRDERDFEFANLVRNPDVATALAPGRLRRQAQIASDEAGLEYVRLLKWILAYAGIGAVWSMESGHDPKPGIQIAELAAAELQV